MSAAHLSTTFSKELDRAAYNELPKHVSRERLRHEVAICGAGGVVRNLIFVARLTLHRITNGNKKAPYPTPPDISGHELRHLEGCAARVVEALEGPAQVAA